MNIHELFRGIEKLISQKDTTDANQAIDALIESHPQFLRQNFYSIQSQIFRLKAKIFFLEQNFSKWIFYSLVCLSKNFIPYLPKFQDEFFNLLKNLNKTEISLISMSKNNFFQNEHLMDQSLIDEHKLFHDFNSPFTVKAFFSEQYCTKEEPFNLHVKFFSSLLNEFKFSELAVYLSISKVDNTTEESKIVLNNEPIVFVPHQVLSYEKELQFDEKIRSISLKYATLTLDNLTLFISTDDPSKTVFNRVLRIPNISHCHMAVDSPPFGIPNAPFPVSIKISLDESSPAPYQIAYQISPFESQQHCYTLQPGDSLSLVENIIEEFEQFDEMNVVFFITSEDSVFPNHIDYPFSVLFKSPFKVFSQCFDESGNELLFDEQMTVNRKYMIITKILLQIDAPVSLSSVELDKFEDSLITLIPIEQKIDLSPGEAFTVASFIIPQTPVLSKSLASFKVKYSPLKYFDAPDSIFNFSLPKMNIKKKIITVDFNFPSIATQYQPHSSSVIVKNETELKMILKFTMNHSSEIMINGFMNYEFVIQPKGTHEINFSFFPLKIGHITFPHMTITNENGIIWNSSPDIFVLFASS
ncbi:hypothetical protein TRFO_25379 [Tritrichomonas foetus]|uniref:Trafficking protein particle complex subunit 11 C-terminal domain-containing protein n=1 Tax=Tritrichomonas foetus TaxID=1144522 RepID=A0A1J4KA45_9EUKA|nr:hypothetical protein TRFO_25379 [Tritrichomonas foetus]|eukprot:OHT06564.1 hypothetical protein TRFO_25379 [Tritrichomonas foetus]